LYIKKLYQNEIIVLIILKKEHLVILSM